MAQGEHKSGNLETEMQSWAENSKKSKKEKMPENFPQCTSQDTELGHFTQTPKSGQILKHRMFHSICIFKCF